MLNLIKPARPSILPENFVRRVYPTDEIEAEPDKASVQLIHFPAKSSVGKKSGKHVIVIAGGGYQVVCSLVEAFPVAARLNELGFDAFVLNYRVRTSQFPAEASLLPRPMEDLAAAVRFLGKHAQQFSVTPENYAVIGFSAGGHLAGSWGTQTLGARAYQLPAPRALGLIYPLITLKNIKKKLPSDVAELFASAIFGTGEKDMERYFIDQILDSSYPPCYLIQNEDDDTVPIEDTRDMARALQKQSIPYQYETHAAGGHGFGLGDATEARGWVRRFVHFWENHSPLSVSDC